MSEKSAKASELATLVQGELVGATDPVVTGLSANDLATEDQISFFSGKIDATEVEKCRAAILLVKKDCQEFPVPVIRVADPVWAAAVIHNFFLARDFEPTGVHSSAVIGEGCVLPGEISLGPHVSLGDRVRLGKRVKIGAGCVIGDDVVIGDDCFLHPNVTILAGSLLGARVILHSGTVVGSDGFGYAHDRLGRHVKRPHVGFVQIDDDVELGANVCVDRATFGKTWIKRGTKVDNLVQIGHNVVIGEDSILVSQAGISGSTELGDGVIMGGKAAVAGHLRIGNRVTMAAKTGVTADVSAGQVIAGFPAMPHRQWLRMVTALPRISELLKEVRDLRKTVAKLWEARSGNND